MAPVTGNRPLLSIVVPVYFEEKVIEEFYSRTRSMCVGIEDRYDHELIFVNDGSIDRTLDILAGLAEKDEHIRIIDLSRNFGHQLAITAGMDHASGDAVVVIDADLQDPPEVIVEMLEKWEQGYKVVYGVRLKRKGESRFKLWTAAIFYRVLQRLSNTRIPLDAGDFRLMDRDVIDVLREIREQNRYMRGLVSWVGFPQYGLPYKRDSRYAGETKYTFKKMLKLAMDGITNFSEKPLYIAGYFGGLVTLVSFLLIIWVLVNKIINPAASLKGWSSLLLTVLFMGGIQLISIGLLGQYIGRIFTETKGRPLYIVSAKYGFPDVPGAEDRTGGRAAGRTAGRG